MSDLLQVLARFSHVFVQRLPPSTGTLQLGQSRGTRVLCVVAGTPGVEGLTLRFL
jgi:hypothetical protein